MRIIAATLFWIVSAAAALAWGPLIEADQAAGADIILDIRGEGDFATGHIAGAANTPYALFRGPRDNPGRVPALDALEAVLEAAGAAPDMDILIVHQGKNATDFGSAARVYWTLKSAGYGSLAILNGGYGAWVDAGGAPATEATPPAPVDLTLTWSNDWMIDAEGVADVVRGEAPAVLIDARPLEFFEGDRKHGAASAAGTLEGALNIVHSTWFRDEGPRFEAPEAMLTQVRTIAAENTGTPLVSFCNTGHWAATNWFAVSELAGVENVKLYPESMVGWTRLGGDVVKGVN